MSKRTNSPPSLPRLYKPTSPEYLTQQTALSREPLLPIRDGFVLFLGFAEVRLGSRQRQLALGRHHHRN